MEAPLAAIDLDPYLTLGIPRDATAAQLKRAFRRQAKEHHPDLHPGPDAAARMARVNEAYALLSDPCRRATWDATHPGAAPDGARPGTAPDGRSHQAEGDAGTRSRSGDASDLDEALAFVLTFGKYRGRSLREVAELEPGYIAWMARSLGNRPGVQRHARIVLAHLEAQGWRDTPRPRRTHATASAAGAERPPARPTAERTTAAGPEPRRTGDPVNDHAGAIGLGLTGLSLLAWVVGIPSETVSTLAAIAAFVAWPIWSIIRDRREAPAFRRGARRAWGSAIGQVALVLVLLWVGWGMLEGLLEGPQPGDIVCEVYDPRLGDCVVESVYEGP